VVNSRIKETIVQSITFLLFECAVFSFIMIMWILFSLFGVVNDGILRN